MSLADIQHLRHLLKQVSELPARFQAVRKEFWEQNPNRSVSKEEIRALLFAEDNELNKLLEQAEEVHNNPFDKFNDDLLFYFFFGLETSTIFALYQTCQRFRQFLLSVPLLWKDHAKQNIATTIPFPIVEMAMQESGFN